MLLVNKWNIGGGFSRFLCVCAKSVYARKCLLIYWVLSYRVHLRNTRLGLCCCCVYTWDKCHWLAYKYSFCVLLTNNIKKSCFLQILFSAFLSYECTWVLLLLWVCVFARMNQVRTWHKWKHNNIRHIMLLWTRKLLVIGTMRQMSLLFFYFCVCVVFNQTILIFFFSFFLISGKMTDYDTNEML